MVQIAIDDFGLNRDSNLAILAVAKTGKVSRVGVLIDGVWTKEEYQELIRLPVKFDLHLDLAYEVHKRVALKEGGLVRSLKFVGALLIGRNWPHSLEISWRQQIEKFRLIWKKLPDGLNSHQHVHFFPWNFRLALGLAKEYQISYIRFGARGLVGSRGVVTFILKFLYRFNKRAFTRSGLKSSEYLSSYDWHAKKLPENTELIMHPERPEELAEIKSPPFPALLKRGIEEEI